MTLAIVDNKRGKTTKVSAKKQAEDANPKRLLAGPLRKLENFLFLIFLLHCAILHRF
jgi:hypothetical protein